MRQTLERIVLAGVSLPCSYAPARTDLSAVLQRTAAKPLPWRLRCRIARDICSGIAFLHSHDVVHRDIKTENVLVRRERESTRRAPLIPLLPPQLDTHWRCVLADYGFARKANKDVAMSARAAMTLCGTDEVRCRRPACDSAAAGEPERSSASPLPPSYFPPRQFMAPEMLWGEAYDDKADVFSFGVTLWEIMTCRVPGVDGFMQREPRSKFVLDFDTLR